MGCCYQLLVQLCLYPLGLQNQRQHSVLPRELSFAAGSQQRAMDVAMLCAAAPEVKESAHLGSSFQPSVLHRLYCHLSLSWGGGSEFDFQLPGCRAIGCARET